MTWIRTASGGKLHYDDPTPDQIYLRDIARGLSKICRFCGQIPTFYSVAEHCILMSRQFDDPELKAWALLHDAAEAYISDIPYPLKQHLDSTIDDIERRILEVVAAKFDLPTYGEKIYPEPVQKMDRRMLEMERRAIQMATEAFWPDVEPADTEPLFMDPDAAPEVFVFSLKEAVGEPSEYRGNSVRCRDDGTWVYCDTGEPVAEAEDHPCGHCGLQRTDEGHDGCLGTLPGVVNACCGHGDIPTAYAQLRGGCRLAGETALLFFESVRGGGPWR